MHLSLIWTIIFTLSYGISERKLLNKLEFTKEIISLFINKWNSIVLSINKEVQFVSLTPGNDLGYILGGWVLNEMRYMSWGL